MPDNLPDPFTPPGCDLRGYDFMPSFGQRLFGSTFYSLALRNPRAGLAGFKLWWEAWVQEPAASLPDDDFDLARLADFGSDIKGWLRVKEIALHGFTKCNDGRLYHRFLATQAIDAYDRRLKACKKRETDRARLQAWRDAQKRDHKSEETHFTAVSEGVSKRVSSQVDSDSDSDSDNKKKDSLADFAGAKSAEVENSRNSKRASKDWSKDRGFAAFRAAYPKPDRAPARTHAAWIKALKIASPAEVMAGLAVHPFNPDEKYRPDPATWLNGQSWRASAAQSTPVPASVPKPIKTTSGVVLSDEDLFQVPT